MMDEDLERLKQLCARMANKDEIITMGDIKDALASLTGRVTFLPRDVLREAKDFWNKENEPSCVSMCHYFLRIGLPFVTEGGLSAQRAELIRGLFLDVFHRADEGVNFTPLTTANEFPIPLEPRRSERQADKKAKAAGDSGYAEPK